MKSCILCGISKPLDEFYNNKAAKDGKTARCKDCRYQRRPKPEYPDEKMCPMCHQFIPPSEKMCTMCHQVLPLSAYHNNRLMRDGKTGRCKSCQSKVAAERYSTNPEYRKQLKNNYHDRIIDKIAKGK